MQKIFNKLAKTKKCLSSVKHKVDLSNITELDDHVEFIVSSVEDLGKTSIDLVRQLEENLGSIAGFGDLATEDLAMANELKSAVDDLGIETPESLEDTIILCEIVKDLGEYSNEIYEHLNKVKYFIDDVNFIR
tara:strand:+ start:185 stop:583 length:399 start_codon:yes stop_codon:yes gene_type:complete